MIIYRPQRGSLDTSMKESKEFVDENAMKQHIVDEWNSVFFASILSVEDIIIDTETFDDTRIGWHDTRYILTKRLGTEHYETPQCIGMCATNYGK